MSAGRATHSRAPVSDFAGYFADFLPTAAELAGAPVPAGLDGISFLPAILGQPQPPHDFLYWEFYEGGDAMAVRFGKWKAIAAEFDSDKVRLYDLSADIEESHNVAAQHPRIAAKALAMLRAQHVPSPLWTRGAK